MKSEDGTFGYIEAGLPNIEGTVNDTDIIGNPIRTGCFYAVGNNASKEGGGGSSNRTYTGFDASLSNSIYGNSNTVQPPSVKVRVKTRYR